MSILSCLDAFPLAIERIAEESSFSVIFHDNASFIEAMNVIGRSPSTSLSAYPETSLC